MIDYCIQNGLREPEYTPFKVSASHWKHNVCLEEGSFFGIHNLYPDEWESKNATAHMGLYNIIVKGNSLPRGCPGPLNLQISNESLLACVPRALSGVGEVSLSTEKIIPAQGTKQAAFKNALLQKPGKKKPPKKKACKRKAGTEVSGDNRPKNANMLPVIGSKIANINVEAPKEEKKRKLTPGGLQNQMKGLTCPSDKLKSTHIFFIFSSSDY